MLERTNSHTDVARQFHRATKYVSVPDEAGEETFMMGSPPDVENAIWEEDWSVEPFPFKVYETLDPMPLPRDFPATAMPALDAIARSGDEPAGERLPCVPDLAALARIGLLSNGILKRGSHRPGGQVIEYRAAGGTGARYHLELYFACGDLPDLAAGLYHYSAQDHSLRQIRSGDVRSILVAAAGREPGLATAPVVLAMTSTFWRNAWRYKGRAYRHALWDAGTCFANVLALAAVGRVAHPARVRLCRRPRQRPARDRRPPRGDPRAVCHRPDRERSAAGAIRLPARPADQSDLLVRGRLSGDRHDARGLRARVGGRGRGLAGRPTSPRGARASRRPDPASADPRRRHPGHVGRGRHPGPPLDPQLRHGDPDRVRHVLDPARPVDARRCRRLPRAGRVAAARPVPHRQQRRRPDARRLPGASEPGGDRVGPGGNVPEPGAAAGRRAGGPGRRPREQLLPDRARSRLSHPGRDRHHRRIAPPHDHQLAAGRRPTGSASSRRRRSRSRSPASCCRS